MPPRRLDILAVDSDARRAEEGQSPRLCLVSNGHLLNGRFKTELQHHLANKLKRRVTVWTSFEDEHFNTHPRSASFEPFSKVDLEPWFKV